MPEKKITPYAKGWMGEARACEYLENRGMVLLERRYRSPYGEIDLVMRDGDTLVFVEVKARSRGRRGDGLAAIIPKKQSRMVQTALQYIGEHKSVCTMRFDAIELTPEGVVHIPNAFEASGVFG